MLIYKTWMKKVYKVKYVVDKVFLYEGWFLFGFIPLYIKRTQLYGL